MSRRPLLILGTAFTSLALVVGTGCSSDDKPLTAEQAAALAESGLLTQEDLPSADWEVTEGEEPEADDEALDTDTDDLFASTAACQELQAAMEELFGSDEEGSEDSSTLAEASRAFNFGGEQIVARSVEASVSVSEGRAEVEAGFELLREVMNADAMRPCFESAFTEMFADPEAGVTITRIDVSEAAKANADAIGIAIDLEALATIIPIKLHMEMHFWPEGPAVGELLMMELNSELLQDSAPEILEAARARLAAAVEANK